VKWRSVLVVCRRIFRFFAVRSENIKKQIQNTPIVKKVAKLRRLRRSKLDDNNKNALQQSTSRITPKRMPSNKHLLDGNFSDDGIIDALEHKRKQSHDGDFDDDSSSSEELLENNKTGARFLLLASRGNSLIRRVVASPARARAQRYFFSRRLRRSNNNNKDLLRFSSPPVTNLLPVDNNNTPPPETPPQRQHPASNLAALPSLTSDR